MDSSTIGIDSPESCQSACLQSITDAFRGLSLDEFACRCWYDAGGLPTSTPDDFEAIDSLTGTGPIVGTDGDGAGTCYKYLPNSNN
eukprot:scaffold34507_cov44-Cyclotella_meneghiniana.AAC.2